jgi:hypothetical protein
MQSLQSSALAGMTPAVAACCASYADQSTYLPLRVCLQLLNEVNARRINDELNVFEGIHKSPIFIGVLLVTAGLQVRLTGA